MTAAKPKGPTKKAFAVKPSPPVVPQRFREPLYSVTEDLLPPKDNADLGEWLHEHRAYLAQGGDENGAERSNHEIINLDNYCPDLLVSFKRALIAQIIKPENIERTAVPEFDLRHIEIHATLYHHGSFFIWHDDAPGYDGELVPSRRLTFCYYMHSTPKMFEGGELEFLDGTKVEPKNNRLVLFHPIQQHRVRPVECWSSHVLHGRWALMGWIHGDAPEGWVERIPKLRGLPTSG